MRTLPCPGHLILESQVFCSVCLGGPLHALPPYFGVGLLQLLCFSYTWTPLPHVTEQGVVGFHFVQLSQAPSTTNIFIISLWFFVRIIYLANKLLVNEIYETVLVYFISSALILSLLTYFDLLVLLGHIIVCCII